MPGAVEALRLAVEGVVGAEEVVVVGVEAAGVEEGAVAPAPPESRRRGSPQL